MAEVIKANWWATDTCDRCPTARPKVTYILKSGGVLMMCGHCARTHRAALEDYLEEEIHAPVNA